MPHQQWGMSLEFRHQAVRKDLSKQTVRLKVELQLLQVYFRWLHELADDPLAWRPDATQSRTHVPFTPVYPSLTSRSPLTRKIARTDTE
jgi:hypothetical protein